MKRTKINAYILNIALLINVSLFGAAEPECHIALLDTLNRKFDPAIIDDANILPKEKDAIKNSAAFVSQIIAQMPEALHAIKGFQENCIKILRKFESLSTTLQSSAATTPSALTPEEIAAVTEVENLLSAETYQRINTLNVNDKSEKKQLTELLNQHRVPKKYMQPFLEARKKMSPTIKAKTNIIQNTQGILDVLNELLEMKVTYDQHPNSYIDSGLSIAIKLSPEDDPEICAFAAEHHLENASKERPDLYHINQEFDVISITHNEDGTVSAEIHECKNTGQISKYIPAPKQQQAVLNVLKMLMRKYPSSWQTKIICNRDVNILKNLVEADTTLHAGQSIISTIEELGRRAAQAHITIHTPEAIIYGHDLTIPPGEEAASPQRRRRTEAQTTPKKIRAIKRKAEEQLTPESPSKRKKPTKKQAYFATFDPHEGTARLEDVAEEMAREGITPENIFVAGESETKQATSRIFTPRAGSTPIPFGDLYVTEAPGGAASRLPYERISAEPESTFIFRPITPSAQPEATTPRTAESSETEQGISGRFSRLSITPGAGGADE